MEVNVETGLEWIRNRSRFGLRQGAERVQILLQRIGNPENKIPMIHVAGTNGKGSTVTFLRYMLQELGLKVGTFISPFVINYNEQIAINGNYISDDALIKYGNKYKKIVELMDQKTSAAGITEFEVITVVAFDYFCDENVDVAVVEVGMGGLLDSTNVISPMVTAITTIGKDHTDFLGETIEDIASHKAGIIKDNVPVVIGNVDTTALAVIKKVAVNKNSQTYCYNKDFHTEYLHPDENWGEVFNFYGSVGKLPNLKVSLLGRHQCENAAVAIQLFIKYCELQDLFCLPLEKIYQGLSKTEWPARMEKICSIPLIILDGTHNDHAVHRLADNLKNEFAGRSCHVLFSALSTKNFELMIETLKKVPNVYMYLTTFEYPKAVELWQMENYKDHNTKVVSIWQEALEDILRNLSDKDFLLATGSLYFVSQVRRYLVSKISNNSISYQTLTEDRNI